MARTSRKKFSLRLYVIAVVFTALAAVGIVALVLFSTGLRYQTIETTNHGEIKFVGKAEGDIPVSGTVYYSDGTTAEIVSAKKAEGVHELETWQMKLIYENGDIYEGEVVSFLRHGVGTLTYSGGDVYEGEFFFDDMQGQGVYTYLSGDRYEGEFSKNAKNGKGVYTWAALADGTFDTYEGYYQDDLRSGEGTYTWADGTRYIGSFAEDAKDGVGALYFPDGAYYQGDFVNDTRTGKGVYKWANGDQYEGDFYKGAITGQGTYTWTENGERCDYTGYFENGKIVLIDEEPSKTEDLAE